MSRAEMDQLGWDECDIILVTGDAYIDHPSFGMALIGRLLEAQGFRVGIISQPSWHSAVEDAENSDNNQKRTTQKTKTRPLRQQAKNDKIPETKHQ
ncbi:MAG: hypothetical protein ACKN9C_00370, partial [Fluviibacter sp.]